MLLVVNMLGAVVSTIETQNLAAGAHYNELNVADLKEGVYFIKTTVNEVVEMTKIVVQH
ncbi:T9SS type A sorting domain-containing protein [Crocinitomicaceae bacterium]|nr:T9SS type A sorting domain-containing protein [Crocinitomicaceae bacterium]